MDDVTWNSRKRSPEEEESIRAMWCEDRMSAAQIEQKTGLTRSAICGLAYRRKWVGGKLRVRHAPQINRKGPNHDWHGHKQVRQPGQKFQPMPTPAPEHVTPRSVFIADLESHHCRWVKGEPKEFMYCGARKKEGSPYCARHHAMSYVPRSMVSRLR